MISCSISPQENSLHSPKSGLLCGGAIKIQVQTCLVSESMAQSSGVSLATSKAEEMPTPFISLLELCHSSVTKVNITAVLFEAALINSSPRDIMLITATEMKSSHPAARHQITRNVEKRAGLTLNALFNGVDMANSHFSSAA